MTNTTRNGLRYQMNMPTCRFFKCSFGNEEKKGMRGKPETTTDRAVAMGGIPEATKRDEEVTESTTITVNHKAMTPMMTESLQLGVLTWTTTGTIREILLWMTLSS